MNEIHLYIVTLLPSAGETGVQTHFRSCYEFAKLNGLEEVQIITPYETNWIVRGVLNRIAKLIGFFDKEWGIIFRRKFQYEFLRFQLLSRLKFYNSAKHIVYAQDPLSAKAALDLRCKGYEIKVVLVIHFNISQAWEVVQRGIAHEEGALYRHFIKTEQEIIPKVNKLIFVSHFMKRKVLERIPKSSTVSKCVIPNTIEYSERKLEYNISGDLITIGTIEPRKNHEFLVHVIAEAHQLGYKYKMTIVGNGELQGKLKNLVQKLSLDRFIKITGYVPNARDLIWYHRAYIHASLMENFPIALVEALACSKPVFAAPVGGIPEVFDDGVEGFYWDLNDIKGSARKIIRVLENNTLYEKMADAACRRYEAKFKTEIVIPALLESIKGK